MRTNNLVSKKQKELLALLQRSSRNGNVSIAEMEAILFKLTEEETHWDDLRFPASSAKEIAGKEPGVEGTTGLLLFDSASTETVAVLAQMPHAWKEGSTLHPHVHWQKTTAAAGNVYWQMEYKITRIGEVMDAAFTTEYITTPVAGTPDIDTADYHMLSELPPINMSGGQLSDCIVILLSRVGGDALDTYGADARFLEFDIHFEINSNGSEEEYVKYKR